MAVVLEFTKLIEGDDLGAVDDEKSDPVLALFETTKDEEFIFFSSFNLIS